MNHDYHLNQKLADLKSQLRIKEYERDKVWSGAWWLWIFILPALIIVIIVKFSKARSLDKEVESLKNEISEIEKEMRSKQ